MASAQISRSLFIMKSVKVLRVQVCIYICVGSSVILISVLSDRELITILLVYRFNNSP